MIVVFMQGNLLKYKYILKEIFKMIDIDKIKEDLDAERMLDVEAEVQRRLADLTADLRDEVEKERDERIAKLEHALAVIDEYDVEEEDECEDENAEDDAEEDAEVEDEEPVTLEDVIPTTEA